MAWFYNVCMQALMYGCVEARRRLGSILWIVCCFGSWSMACSKPEPRPLQLRVNLFDLMEDAQVESRIPLPKDVGETNRTIFDFEQHQPEVIWFGRAFEEGVAYEEGFGDFLFVSDREGIAGSHLRIGPGVSEDRSRAVFVLPASGLTKIRIQGKVRHFNNPRADAPSSREVVRITEHNSEVLDPTRLPRWANYYAKRHRIARRIEPGPWDSFDFTFMSQVNTRSIVIELLHRSGRRSESVTAFDELEISAEIQSEGQILTYLRGKYRPRDGRENRTPWRLRVPLSKDDRWRQEVRDAVYVRAGNTLAIPVEVPDPSKQPQLRFGYGMFPEAITVAGDGIQIQVSYTDKSKADTELAMIEFDPRNQADHRGWQEAKVDLTPVSGRTGMLKFYVQDIPDSEPDKLDGVLLANPRMEPQASAPTEFNVLLIGVDTVRADHLSAFGYERNTTPNLRAIAEKGVRFSNTRSQAPWTLPSFSSILTSLYPSVHGAGRGGHDEWTGIDTSTLSLAELLSAEGYETYGIVANGLISPQYGLDQGFQGYQSAWAMESVAKDSPRVQKFIEQHRQTPWLLFWHIMDPHLPYTTEEQHRREFTDKEYAGQFANSRRPQVPFQVLDPRPGRRWFAHEGPPPLPDLSEADQQYVSDYYDAELAETDAAIGRVLETLKETGQWERTIVAVIADHGEGLGDHNHYHHGYTLYEDQVHIPMLIRVPGRYVGLEVTEPVAAIDLAPTLMGILGLRIPQQFQGVDLLDANHQERPGYFIEYPTYDSSAQKAWVEGNFKYLNDPIFHTEELYDLKEDPHETKNIAAEHPEFVVSARRKLQEFRWHQLQKGRFHLRLAGLTGQEVSIRIVTDDLFDANFATWPILSDKDFKMDLERKSLSLKSILKSDQLELVFWCRGKTLSLNLTVDGRDITSALYTFAEDDDEGALGREFSMHRIARRDGKKDPWPPRGSAYLWEQHGFDTSVHVIPSPEQIELLEQLGYAH